MSELTRDVPALGNISHPGGEPPPRLPKGVRTVSRGRGGETELCQRLAKIREKGRQRLTGVERREERQPCPFPDGGRLPYQGGLEKGGRIAEGGL